MQPLQRFHETASQTAGPYVHIGCLPNLSGITGVYPQDLGAEMVTADEKATRITLCGVIFDGTGSPLRDAMVEIWQADAQGRLGHNDPRGGADPAFHGWGRCASDAQTGEWRIDTIKPGPVPFPDGRMMAPHVTFWIAARGINIGLHTRMYFPEEVAANANDPVLQGLEHQIRVPTLIATRETGGEYRFNIHLQGPEETVFFDV
jgi:protocatechuate 3,4-dioxygenase alpha subunit